MYDAMNQSTHTAAFSSSTRSLQSVRYFVEAFVEQADYSETFIAQLKRAVDDAFAGVVERVYRGEAGQPLQVVVTVDPDRFTVCIRDRGEALDAGRDTKPDLRHAMKHSYAGVLGVKPMHRLVDRVVYQTSGPVHEGAMTRYREAC